MAKILLADDSTHAQRMGAKILTAEGHQVSTVSNGQAAIQALEKATPELIIADVFMPGRNGYEVCHYIKTDEKLKKIPVLLIIGAMEPYDPEEGRRAGADGLITKPLESSSLVSTVKDLLAAAKRFAPARAVPKESTSAKIAIEEPAKEPVEETPQWEETPEEITAAPPEEKLEIPEDLSQQPIGMLTDIMRESEAAEPTVMEAPIEFSGGPFGGLPVEAPATMEESPEPDLNEPASMLPDTDSPPQLDIAEKSVWTAEAAKMTAEEAKLFEQPNANWGDLEQLVDQSAGEQPAPAPAPLPWQAEEMPTAGSDGGGDTGSLTDHEPGLETREDVEVPINPDPMLIRPEETPAEVSSDPGIEHYENLDAVVEAQGPVAQAPEPAPPEPPPEEAAAAPEFSGPVEELEASPEERSLPPLEQLVRQAVEDLMPEIIERVQQSLKK